MKLSPRFLELQREHGLSIEDLATRSGVSANTIQRIRMDAANPRLSTLVDLARVFGIPVHELLKPAKEYHGHHTSTC